MMPKRRGRLRSWLIFVLLLLAAAGCALAGWSQGVVVAVLLASSEGIRLVEDPFWRGLAVMIPLAFMSILLTFNGLHLVSTNGPPGPTGLPRLLLGILCLAGAALVVVIAGVSVTLALRGRHDRVDN